MNRMEKWVLKRERDKDCKGDMLGALASLWFRHCGGV